ncbi:uncharacterized protein CBL_09839 [Carabus blaptoides fortunei]
MSKTGNLLLKQYMKFFRSGQGFENVLKKVDIVSAKDGKCKAEFVVQPEQTNAFGYLHGGFSATLCDIVSGIALLSHEREGGGVSVNMNLTFMKTAAVGDTVQVDATTIKLGRTMGFLEIAITNKETGELLVSATHTKFVA